MKELPKNRQLFCYIRKFEYFCRLKIQKMENKELYQLRDEFLRTWPLERVKGMAIEEYTNLNKKDSFCYWLEAITQDLGSIWGGSAFKFGIYKRKDTKRKFEKNALSDGEYAWLAKYGKTKDEAFNKGKSIIVDIIEMSKARNFKAIEPIDLGNATKWKIAHLYSDNYILNVFSKDSLTGIAKKLGLEFDKKISFYDLQDLVLKQKSTEEDYFTFAKRIWSLTANKEAKYWLYSPGEQAFMWEEFYDEGIMAIGWDELEDLENYTDRKSILEALIENYGGGEDQRNNVSAIDDFCYGENKINIGDIVIVKKGTKTLLGYGRVTSDYYYDENREEFLHCREVEWFKKGEWEVDVNLPRKTLTDVTTYNSDIEGIKYDQYLLNIINENTQAQENNLITKLLKYKPQIILQGPPGTGKTREAKRIAKALLGLGENDSLEGNEQFKLIQFHPSYSYEDFVRGIIAETVDEKIKYFVKDKILGSFAQEALKDKDKPYVLVIDEINRANLSAVLGELIYALEYRGEAVQSMYAIDGENNLILPPNLYIIGTMNTADRSVGHIDYAIRRRFAFVNVLPKELEKDFHKELFRAVSELFISNYDEYISNPDIELKRALTLSNEFKSEDVWLGHSYFITKNTPIDIRWEYEIKPILLEYIKDGILINDIKIGEQMQKIKKIVYENTAS